MGCVFSATWSLKALSRPKTSRAISTILFASFSIGPVAFALGITSLLSSLIAIGFGVGLIYVLGDVKGFRLHVGSELVHWH